MQPRLRSHRPITVLILLRKYLRDVLERDVIVRCFVLAHASPVDSFRSEMRIRISIDQRVVAASGVSPLLTHKRDTSQTHLEVRAELLFSQISLEPPSLLSILIEDQNGRRPDGIKPVKIFWILFDVDFEWDEVLVNELRDFFIFVRLGFQPSTCASAGCGAEIDEYGFLLFFRRGESLVSIFDPVYGHDVGLQLFR